MWGRPWINVHHRSEDWWFNSRPLHSACWSVLREIAPKPVPSVCVCVWVVFYLPTHMMLNFHQRMNVCEEKSYRLERRYVNAWMAGETLWREHGAWDKRVICTLASARPLYQTFVMGRELSSHSTFQPSPRVWVLMTEWETRCKQPKRVVSKGSPWIQQPAIATQSWIRRRWWMDGWMVYYNVPSLANSELFSSKPLHAIADDTPPYPLIFA